MINVILVNYVPWKWGSGDPIFFLHESTRGVEIRLHTENQHPRCPGSGLKVCGGQAVLFPADVGTLSAGNTEI